MSSRLLKASHLKKALRGVIMRAKQGYIKTKLHSRNQLMTRSHKNMNWRPLDKVMSARAAGEDRRAEHGNQEEKDTFIDFKLRSNHKYFLYRG